MYCICKVKMKKTLLKSYVSVKKEEV